MTAPGLIARSHPRSCRAIRWRRARHGGGRKLRLKCRAVADSLEKAGDKLFTFTRFPLSQWKSIRTSNAIKRLLEEFKRRIKTQTVLPCAETTAMLFWALLASGQTPIGARLQPGVVGQQILGELRSRRLGDGQTQ